MNEGLPTIERAYRVRLYPTPAQADGLRRVCGTRRWVWNWALGSRRDAYRRDGTKLTLNALSQQLTSLRQGVDPKRKFLGEVPRMPLDQALRDLDTAYRNFFAGRARYPRFSSKLRDMPRARFMLDQRRAASQVDRERGRVQLDGIGKVRFRVTEPMVGRLRSVTVRLNAAGQWHASFTADGVPAPAGADPVFDAVGVDLGLKTAMTASRGPAAPAPKALAKRLKRLRRYQRHYVRQRDAAARRQGLDPTKPFPKGTRIKVSNRMKRTRQQVGRLHVRISDARASAQHQATTALVRSAQVICLEDLNVKAMGRSLHRGFRRGVADAALGELRRQISYKAGWYGRTLSVVDRFYPSSKTCSTCGEINADLKLQHRVWTCRACGAEHDRDHNAALNIEREGLRLLTEATAPDGGTGGRPETNARGAAKAPASNASLARRASASNRERIPERQRRSAHITAGTDPPGWECG